MKKIFFLGIYLFCSNTIQAQWQISQIENSPSIRAIDGTSSENLWISGSKGNILLSKNGGKTWNNMCPEEYKDLDFRGISVLNQNTILAMSAGDASEGKALVIRSTDGGKTWEKVLEKTEKGIFFDTIKFKDAKNGFIIGDPIDKKPYLLHSSDAGKTWLRVQNLPDINEGDASYAASNSCITFEGKNVWFHTQDRVFHSKNEGKDWAVYNTPFKKGSSQGIFGIFAVAPKKLIVVGGDYLPNPEKQLQYAYSNNQGKGWHFKEDFWKIGLTESISSLKNKNQLVSVGTHGSAFSKDLGKTWTHLDNKSFHVIKCFDNYCVASGANGQVGTQKF